MESILTRIDNDAHAPPRQAHLQPLHHPEEESDAHRPNHGILYGSNMGNANSHVTTNSPVIFAGGGFRHGQHLAFDTERNYPLPNLCKRSTEHLSHFCQRLGGYGIYATRLSMV